MVDYVAITERQQAMWATGDFHRIGVAQVGVGERLARSVPVLPNDRVLDVAAGAGNTALAAARRFADVLATDYVPDLLGHAEERARAEGLPLRCEVADAQALPYDDGSFDVVLSTFGAMFAPDQERTAAEMMRVLRPGGRLGLACWTPESMIGEMFALGARFMPPADGLRPPSRWGTEAGIHELLGRDAAEIRMRTRTTDFTYPSLEFMLEWHKRWFGPTAVTFATLDQTAATDYGNELMALWSRHNVADNGTVLARGSYLETVVVKA